MQQEECHHSEADEEVDFPRGTPAYLPYYQVDLGKEEMLQNVDPKWWVCHWLQLAVQGISDREMPWFGLVAPLTLGAEGTALTLAKGPMVMWRWSVLVKGADACLPAPTILNMGQFMTEEEVAEKVGSCTGM